MGSRANLQPDSGKRKRKTNIFVQESSETQDELRNIIQILLVYYRSNI
jgi:hypothetical protein